MSEFYFDEKEALRVEQFFADYLLHVKGRWSGKPFVLLEWQKKIIQNVFGWKNKEGLRKYRTVYIEVPRKQGKSQLCAGLSLYLLLADGEMGGEVYNIAGDRAQAALVFDIAKGMYLKSAKLKNKLEVFKRLMFDHKTMSKYEVLSADADLKHGLNASGIIIDELHVQPNRELVDVMVTSTGARQQPLTIMITTAGYDKNSICWEYHDYAEKIINGKIKDESFYGIIYAAEEKDNWESEETWKKANPSLGKTISLDYLRGEYNKAKEVPSYQNTFRRLHLNQWTSQETRFIEMDKWNKCGSPIDFTTLRNRDCFGGLDLSATTDLSAFVLLFPPTEDDNKYTVLPYFWIPAENMRQRELRDRVPYEQWVREGYIETTEGNVIDYTAIKERIKNLATLYNIKAIAFDPWNATQTTLELAEQDGFNMIEMRQGYASMSAPTKELLKLILSKKINHGNNPVLNYMAECINVTSDPAGNIKPDKTKRTFRIDGIVALIMALDKAHRQQTSTSIYETRGLIAI